MYKITAKFPSGNDLILYDPAGTGALPILGPKQTEELNQPGSLTFSLLYPHEAYGLLEGMKTYISSEKEGTEIFYGRVLDVEPDELTGQETVTCEGALSFLNDGFLSPDPKNSSGTTQSQTMTAEAFFRRCIDEFNADIDNDPRRVFTVGNVTVARKDETRLYQITQFTSAKEAIEQNLLNNYGGFLKVYRSLQGQLMIDWVEDYGVVNGGRVELGENVISQSNRLSGENLFTAIRPVGKDGLVHSTTPIIDVYPTEEMAEYGRIVKNVDFPSITSESDLLAAGQALVQRINKTIYRSSEISLLDLSFVDDEEPEVNLGNRYTNIAGLEGDEVTVSTRNRDYENPQNDSISLKNAKHLEGNGIDDFKNNEGGISKQSSRSSGGVGMALKYYHELQDEAAIYAQKVNITAEKLLELHADDFILSGNNLETLSRRTQTIEGKITTIEGTGVYQNSDHITQVAGNFTVERDEQGQIVGINVIEGSKFSVEEDGVYSEVLGANGVQSRINQSANSIRLELGTKATVYYQKSDPASVAGNTVKDKDLWIESIKIDSHNDAESFTYSELGQHNWIEYYGAIIHVRENGVWKEATNQQRAEMLFAENEFNIERVNLIRGDLDSMYSQFTIEKGQIRSIVEDVNNGLKSSITQTASQIRSELTDTKNGLSSSITQTAGQIRSEVADSVNELQSAITQESDRISLVVEGTGTNAHIKPAQIVAAINRQTGQSIVRLSADMVEMDGNVNLSDIIEITENDGAYMHSTEIEDLTIIHSLWIDDAGVSIYGSNGDSFDMDDIVVDASVSGNVLTLHTLGGDEITFSKATTLSSSWSGSNTARVLTVTAKQNNVSVGTRTVGFGTALNTHDLDLALDSNGTPTAVQPTGGVLSIDCPVKLVQLTSSGNTTYYTKDVRFNPNGLLQAKSTSSNGTITPDSGYIGLSQVTVSVPQSYSWGTQNWVSNTNGLPSGKKHQVNDLKTVIVNNRTKQGYIYFTININGTTHVFYFVDNGNSWAS